MPTGCSRSTASILPSTWLPSTWTLPPVIGLVIVWEATVRIFEIPRVAVPSASESFYAIYEYRVGLWHNAMTTLIATVLGFGIAVVFGVGMGIAIGVSPTAYAALYPLMVAFNSIPKVAIVPILMLWFGIGLGTATITAFMLCFFPDRGEHGGGSRYHRAGA